MLDHSYDTLCCHAAHGVGCLKGVSFVQHERMLNTFKTNELWDIRVLEALQSRLLCLTKLVSIQTAILCVEQQLLGQDSQSPQMCKRKMRYTHGSGVLTLLQAGKPDVCYHYFLYCYHAGS